MSDRLSTLLRSIASPRWGAVLALLFAACLLPIAFATAAAAPASALAHGATLGYDDCGAGASDCERVCSSSCPAPEAWTGISKPPSWRAEPGFARAWPVQWPDKAVHLPRQADAPNDSLLHGRLRL